MRGRYVFCLTELMYSPEFEYGYKCLFFEIIFLTGFSIMVRMLRIHSDGLKKGVFEQF